MRAAKVIPKRAVRPRNTTLSVEKLKRDYGMSIRAPADAFLELKQGLINKKLL